MNVFTFLKGKAGKFVLGFPQKVALTAALGGAAAGVVYFSGSDGQPKDTAPTRAYVMGSSGRNQGDDGSLGRENTINIAGARGIRSADGGSAAAGYDWAASDASVAAVDRLGGGAAAGGGTPGARGMSGRSEGLGGNNDIVAVNGKVVAGGGDALAAAGAAAGSRAAAAAQRGVMATASGGVSGNMYGGAGSRAGGRVNGGTVNGGGNSLGTGDGYKLSGAMPDGSSYLASAKFKDGSAHFGDTRGARAGRGMNSGEGRTLSQVAKRSADIARNKNRSANEAGRAFLASSQDSGGIQLDDGGQLTEGAVSDDFEAPTIAARKALDQTADETWKSELQRKRDRTRIQRSMISLIFLTIPAMFAISALMKSTSIFAKIAAVAIGAAMLVAIGLFMADAIKYMKNWGGSGITTASMIVGPLLAGMIAASYLEWVYNRINALASWINDIFGAPIVGAASAISTGTGAVGSVKDSVGGLKSKNPNDLENQDLTKSA